MPFPQPWGQTWQFWLDLAALGGWGLLLLKYRISGQIYYLLHPDYIWLTSVAALVLLAITLFRLWEKFGPRAARRSLQPPTGAAVQHISFFPKGLGSGLLVGVAILGLFYTPRPFASDIALQRGVTDTLMMTRSQPQSFRVSRQPEERSLLDWIRTINVYPEPDAYSEQPVNVDGFVVYPPDLPNDYLMISRFIITCCAADAYPVGLPVKLKGDRTDYPADEWFRVTGTMATESLNGQRQLVIVAQNLESIPTPRNPYDY